MVGSKVTTGRERGEESVMMVVTSEGGNSGRVNRASATTPPMEWAIIRTEVGRV